MMIRTILMVVGLLLVVVMPAVAKHGDTSCAPRDVLLEVLDERFHQVPVATGLAGSGVMLEIYASADGTWTMLATQPDGNSCVKGTGTHWELVEVLKGIAH